MKQVEIFKTDVEEETKANQVISLLDKRYPEFRVNFDMDDEDHILRIESIATPIIGIEIEVLLAHIGVCCEIFAD